MNSGAEGPENKLTDRLETDRSPEDIYEELLQLVREGRNRMDELADSLGLTGAETEYAIRTAEQHGDIVRRGYTGRNLYTVALTDQGADRLPPLSEWQATLAEQKLNEMDWEVLTIVAEQGPCLSRGILENMSHDIAPMQLIPVVNHLVREEYLSEYGLWRRYLETTDAGRQTIKVLGRE